MAPRRNLFAPQSRSLDLADRAGRSVRGDSAVGARPDTDIIAAPPIGEIVAARHPRRARDWRFRKPESRRAPHSSWVIS